ncbi:hypothetical protein, partial [Bacteroides ovatus]|uniref:hypothetical protein n=1 Tax=Bacteroides ovatus TaxID=28116 RepID=UPI001E5B3E9D
WQKPGQQNVAQELIKIIINYVAELRDTFSSNTFFIRFMVLSITKFLIVKQRYKTICYKKRKEDDYFSWEGKKEV